MEETGSREQHHAEPTQLSIWAELPLDDHEIGFDILQISYYLFFMSSLLLIDHI
jgi:hypothetical protein